MVEMVRLHGYMAAAMVAALILAAMLGPPLGAQEEPPQTPLGYTPTASLVDESSNSLPWDLLRLDFASNSTHLMIDVRWSGAIPEASTRSSSLQVYAGAYIYFDLDGRSDTGYGARYEWYPNMYDAYLSMRHSSESSSAYLYVYNATGYMVHYVHGPVTHRTSTSDLIAVAYSDLNVSSGDVITINGLSARFDCLDFLPDAANTSLPEAGIVVDGSSLDWSSQGISPLIVDSGDYARVLGGMNLTELYLAVNSTTDKLYIGGRLEGIPLPPTTPPTEYGYDSLWEYIYFVIDTNNDGGADYRVSIYQDHIYIYDVGARRGRSYNPRSGSVEIAFNTSFIEAGIPLSYIGLAGYSPGNDVSFRQVELVTGISDSVHRFSSFTSIVLHRVGTGFRVAHLFGGASFSIRGGLKILAITPNSTMIVETESNVHRTYVSMREFMDSPLPVAAVPPRLGGYYLIETSSVQGIHALVLKARYDEGLRSSLGINSSRLRLYYYSEADGVFKPLGTLVDRDTRSLIASIPLQAFTGAYGKYTALIMVSYGSSPGTTTKTVTHTETRSTTFTETTTRTETMSATHTITTTLTETTTIPTTSTSTTTLTETRTVSSISTATVTETHTSTRTSTVTQVTPSITTATYTETISLVSTKTVTEKAYSMTPWILVVILIAALASLVLARRS